MYIYIYIYIYRHTQALKYIYVYIYIYIYSNIHVCAHILHHIMGVLDQIPVASPGIHMCIYGWFMCVYHIYVYMSGTYSTKIRIHVHIPLMHKSVADANALLCNMMYLYIGIHVYTFISIGSHGAKVLLY